MKEEGQIYKTCLRFFNFCLGTFTYYGSLKIEKLLKIVFLAQIGSSQDAEAGKCDFDSFFSLVRTGNFLRELDVIWAPLFSRHLARPA